MFRGLLKRVEVDLVRTCPNCGTVSGVQLTDCKKANGIERPSFCASLIQDPDRASLSEIEMSFLAGIL